MHWIFWSTVLNILEYHRPLMITQKFRRPKLNFLEATCLHWIFWSTRDPGLNILKYQRPLMKNFESFEDLYWISWRPDARTEYSGEQETKTEYSVGPEVKREYSVGPETKTEYSVGPDTWTRYHNNAELGTTIEDFAKKETWIEYWFLLPWPELNAKYF